LACRLLVLPMLQVRSFEQIDPLMIVVSPEGCRICMAPKQYRCDKALLYNINAGEEGLRVFRYVL
jgi:hypothetical protein